jgi:hypothetical protein
VQLVAYNPGAFSAGPAVWARGVRATSVQGQSVSCCAVESLLLGEAVFKDLVETFSLDVLSSSQAVCMSCADEIGNIS